VSDQTIQAALTIFKGALPLRMLCGCRLEESDPFALDEDGFVVCPTHRQRRYGWRSVPYTATRAPMQGVGMWTELEYENFILFGVAPISKTTSVQSSVVDRRDNSDPEEVGLRLLASKNGGKAA